MISDLKPGSQLVIHQQVFTLAEHPAAPGMPYGQEGRQAVVYQLLGQSEKLALKVFKPRFRLPSLVTHARLIAPLAELPGLHVCQRTVLSPSRHADLLKQHPDLLFAVLMPWVEGATWQEVILKKQPLTPAQSLELARTFATILLEMEERGIAHCDLSGPNILLSLPQEEQPLNLALVDVEGLFAPGLSRPEALPSGSSGYAHRTAPQGLWNQQADRFAGALLICEMLAWCNPELCQAADGESYFNPVEVQQPCQRYSVIESHLSKAWGQPVMRLLQRAWTSSDLSECPTFGEWLLTLPENVPQPQPTLTPAKPVQNENSTALQTLLSAARRLEQVGNLTGAVEIYYQALALCQPGSGLHLEVQAVLARMEKKLIPQTPIPTPIPVAPPAPPLVPDSTFEKTRVCPTCGLQIPIGMAVCPSCEGQPTVIEKPQKRRWWIPLAWFGSLFMLAVVIWLFIPKSPQATLAPTASPLPIITPTNATAPATEPTQSGSTTPPFCISIGQTWISPEDAMTLVCVPAGWFLMGSSSTDTIVYVDEEPQHKVYLDAYWIDQTEVTNAMYEKCVKEGKCPISDTIGGGNYPQVNVSWFDAKAYCDWAGRQLPSEAQWEKAARGSDGQLYPWGNEVPDSTYLNFKNWGATAVRTYEKGKSPYAAYDMAGNVLEWVMDWYSGSYYSSQLTWPNPSGPTNGDNRVLRGGSWSDNAYSTRAARRYGQYPTNRSAQIGFRCVR